MLKDYQMALGRLVRAPGLGESPWDRLVDLKLTPGEQRRVDSLLIDPGLHFTISVQRSWCRDRSRKAAYLTLSLLPPAQQESLLDEWVEHGGGAVQFFASEANDFLEFISNRVPAPSYALSICRMEQAIHHTNAGVPDFSPLSLPEIASEEILHRGKHAALVEFFAEPGELFDALQSERPLPPMGEEVIPILFGPGISGLFRHATKAEAALWRLLSAPFAMKCLVEKGYDYATVDVLLGEGVLSLTA